MRLWPIGFIAVTAIALGADGDAGSVLVVADPTVPVYQEALVGLKQGLGQRIAAEVAPGKAAGALANIHPRVAVAVGADAVAELAKAKVTVPVVSTMLLLSDVAGLSEPLARPVGSVYLDLEMLQVIAELERLFPNKKRVGLIVGPSRASAPNRAVMQRLEEKGYKLVVVESPQRANLGEALRQLFNRADLLLCLPDSSLFDSKTIPLLLRVALEHKLPVVGYSAAFVRAGAIAGVFPDYVDIGLQTAAMTVKALQSPGEVGDETPRKIASTTNQTVLRLLGWAR